MNPEVSVIIPTYNSEDYLAQALESVLNQTFRNLEIILIDDASTDATLKIARSFSDRRLKIISNSQNRGVSYGRNCGIRQARGTWIALLDSDDWYAPERLERLLQVAERQNADLVADNLFLIRDRQPDPWSTLLQENDPVIQSVELIDAVKFVISDRPNSINARRNWSLGYTKPLIKREFLIENQLEYNETIRVGEDFILYLECLRHQAHFYLVAQPYYYYRTRASSLSARKPVDYLAQSCEITRNFMHQETALNADSQLFKALKQNLAVFHKRLTYHRAVENFKAKRILNVLKLILACPLILDYFIDKVISLLEAKIISRQNIKSSDYLDVTVS